MLLLPIRRFRSFVVVALALLAFPVVAGAGNLCLQDSNGRLYQLNKVSPKVASAKAKPFGGVSVAGGYVRPLSGVATRSANNQKLALAFTLYSADVTSNGYTIAGASEFHQIAAAPADGSWDVGDVANDCYWEGGIGAGAPACMVVTVVDCGTIVVP